MGRAPPCGACPQKGELVRERPNDRDPGETAPAPSPFSPEPGGIRATDPPTSDDTVATPPPESPDRTVAAAPPAAPRSDDRLDPVHTIGVYPIEAELGRGGMGVVYRATDPRLRRPVALKVLTGAITRDADAFGRFEREAQTLAALNHPNIATIYSLEDADGSPFFTMEWIAGGTLAHRLEGGAIPLETLISIARQVARALEAAHARGIIHRDLKPANVMITPDDTAKILDFGIAAAFGIGVGIAPSSLAEVSGTPSYMSPEQYRGEPVDPSTDAWSFGCLLFECLTGSSPFAASSFADCRDAVLGAEPEWGKLPAETPARLRELVERTLEKDRTRRLASLAEARRILEELLVRGGVTARLAEASPAPSRPATATLPRSLTRFIGREESIAAVEERLESAPLVTLTGAGGCGKSRLALEVARKLGAQFQGGIWLVELAPIRDEERVLPAIAQALSLRESPGEDLGTTIVRRLDGCRSLLLIDNCEHLLEGCARAVEFLLSLLPELRILASSREALGVPGEEVVTVPPLALPREGKKYSVAELEVFESVRLFIDRASSVRREFSLTERDAAAVAQIVRRLDGIPLAIELAAARVKVLPLAQIATRLDDRFRLLTGGSRTALPRQQTLRATIEWSYELLDEDERRLLRRLSVFVAGFTLESVERVCSGEGTEEWEILDRLSLLVDKSLVEVEAPDDDPDAIPRYRLLETVREYARERFLEDGDVTDVQVRHLETFLDLAESGESGASAPAWHRRLDHERANLRVALEFSLSDPERSECALRLVDALGNHRLIRGQWEEGRDAARRALEHDAGRPAGETRAHVLGWAARYATSQGDFEPAAALAKEVLEIEQTRENPTGVAGAWNDLGVIARQRGDHEEARDHFRRSLEIRREIDDAPGTAVALHNIALCELKQHHLEAAETALAESRGIFRRDGDRQKVAVSLAVSGSVAYERGDLETAERIYREALEIAQELGDRRAERSLFNNLGMIAERNGDIAAAIGHLEESLEIREELGDRAGRLSVLSDLARFAVELGDLDAARARASEAIELFTGIAEEADRIAGTLTSFALAIDAVETAARWTAAVERHLAAENEENDLTPRVRERAGAEFVRWREVGDSHSPEEIVAAARKLLSGLH